MQMHSDFYFMNNQKDLKLVDSVDCDKEMNFSLDRRWVP